MSNRKGIPHTKESRRKMSISHKGKKLPEETKRKISESLKGRKMSEEAKRKLSESRKCMKFSKEHVEKLRVAALNMTDERRRKIGETSKGRYVSKQTREKISKIHKGKSLKEEHKVKISAGMQQISIKDWDGYVSYEPYCSKFNLEKREEIRNRDNRYCQMPECGKSEILNGRRLAVHHIDGDKMQGCDGKRWGLVALCLSCNSKSDTLEKEFLIVSNLNMLKGE